MSDASPTPPSAGRSSLASASAAGLRLAAVAGAALLLLGCSGDSSSAQEEAVVPSDVNTVRERADRSRVRGDSAAPVQLFEIADFQCQYCAQYYRETYPAIDSLYVETGDVRYVFITYPNANHPRAWPAVEAAFCAGAAGKFWEMHDLLFERQEDWTGADEPVERFVEYADEIGVDTESFSACVENDRTASMQVRDLEQVSQAGISSTPFFIINNEVSLEGAVPLERFRTVLDSVLAAPEGGDGDGGDDGDRGGDDLDGDDDGAPGGGGGAGDGSGRP